jgi:hypothetical protein
MYYYLYNKTNRTSLTLGRGHRFAGWSSDPNKIYFASERKSFDNYISRLAADIKDSYEVREVKFL